MSAEKLILTSTIGTEIEIDDYDKEFCIEIKANESSLIFINRGQAHLLMLYLQEHLGYKETINPIPDKKLYYCPNCEKMHPANYICKRLG